MGKSKVFVICTLYLEMNLVFAQVVRIDNDGDPSTQLAIDLVKAGGQPHSHGQLTD